jgi:hypothetical protein
MAYQQMMHNMQPRSTSSGGSGQREPTLTFAQAKQLWEAGYDTPEIRAVIEPLTGIKFDDPFGDIAAVQAQSWLYGMGGTRTYTPGIH